MAIAKIAKSTKPVTAYGFKGMSNLPEYAAKLLDREGQISPQVVLNADVTDGGVLQARGGHVLTKALANCHSAAGEERGLSVMLCVADGVTWPQALYRVERSQAQELCEVTGPRARVSYAEIDNVIYISNPYWKASYDILAGVIRSWGISLPLAPDIALVDGDLPPGTYSLCYTNVAGDRVGGNGPVVQIRWEGGAQGILLRNLPSGALTWITHPNGDTLFLAPITNGVVTGQSPWLKPLPTFMVQPPPGFVHFIYAFGRIWGALGKKLFYSDPSQYEWFRPANFMPFLEDVVLVAPVTGGLYINSLRNTWYLEGTDPAKMKSSWVGNGATPGSLAMVQVPAAVAGGAVTSDLFGKASKMPTPVWMAPTGFVVGSHGGNLTYLTENKMHIPVRTQGASLYRLKGGIPQVVSTMWGLLPGEDSLEDIFTRGRVYVPQPTQLIGSVGVEIGGT